MVMPTPANQWVFLSVIRLIGEGPGQNNTLQLSNIGDLGGGTSALITIPPGLYCLGLGGIEGVFGVADLAVFGITCLLETVAGLITDETGADCDLVLDTGSTVTSLPNSPTGHIHVWSDGVPFRFDWLVGATLVDPAWFGIAKTAGVYPDTAIAGIAWQNISQISSTLAVVGSRVLGAEPIEEGYKVVGVVAGDETVSSKTFGDGVAEFTGLRVNVAGHPRNSPDSGFHTLRRWARHLMVHNKAKKRFFYIPDLAKGQPAAWDPDDLAVSRLWGFREFCIDPMREFAFQDVRRFEQSNSEWQLIVPVRGFRA